MYEQAGGCNPVAIELLTGIQLLIDDWKRDPYVKRYVDLTLNGGRKIGGPLLITQGKADPNISFATTMSTVEKLARAFPDSQLEYFTLPGIRPDWIAKCKRWREGRLSTYAGCKYSSPAFILSVRCELDHHYSVSQVNLSWLCMALRSRNRKKRRWYHASLSIAYGYILVLNPFFNSSICMFREGLARSADTTGISF